jgi:CheY-like chemotaxis protein
MRAEPLRIFCVLMDRSLGILLAEDEETDVFLLQRAFKAADISNPLFVVRDGEEAIEYLSGGGAFSDRRAHPLPALLILDIKMPKKTGMEVLQWLRKQPVLNSLPVLMMSSSALPRDIERAYQLGANAFVVKPSGTEERAQLASYIKGFWLRFNRPPLMCTEGLEAARKLLAEPLTDSIFF